MLKEGYVQIYTGDGKGKTTAAMGLAIRAVGEGLKVGIIQFLKARPTGEIFSIEKLDNIETFRFQKSTKFTWELNEEERKIYIDETREAYNFAMKMIRERKYDLLILDEILAARNEAFLTTEDILRLIDNKKSDMELVITGRNAPDELIEKADLVTEMKMIKHYYEKGVNQRKGIEF